MTKNTASRPVALSLTVLGALARLIPHPPNFAPVGAASLFAGARLPVWQAYLVPIALMAITDPILGAFYGAPAYSSATIFIYASFLVSRVARPPAARDSEGGRASPPSRFSTASSSS